MSSRFVNPFTDLVFKIIFGQPASKDLLIILLNELLSGEYHIEDLTFLDKEDRSENIHDKGIIYDLSLIHISEPTRRTPISYAVFCLKKKN